LEQQLRQSILQEMIGEWREELDIERFDINGKPLPLEGSAEVEAAAEDAPAE